jgi:hypothetical protein
VFVAAGPIIALLGVGGWWYEASRGPHGPSLRHPSALAVDDAGNVFVYTAYATIRVFDRDGAELRRWSVRTGSGAAALAFDADGALHVAAIRNDMHYRFDAHGKLLDQQKDAEAFHRLFPSDPWSATGPQGETHAIRGQAIVRVRPSGEVEVVVPAPPAWLPVTGPHALLAVPFGMMSILLGLLLRSHRREERDANLE